MSRQIRSVGESVRLDGGAAEAWAPRQEQPMTTASKVLAETDTEAARALRIIEGMPGHAWSADAAGRFTYISPNTLAFLGEARENLNTSDDEDEFGWRRVVQDRKSVVSGKSVSVGVDIGGRGIIKKKK